MLFTKDSILKAACNSYLLKITWNYYLQKASFPLTIAWVWKLKKNSNDSQYFKVISILMIIPITIALCIFALKKVHYTEVLKVVIFRTLHELWMANILNKCSTPRQRNDKVTALTTCYYLFNTMPQFYAYSSPTHSTQSIFFLVLFPIRNLAKQTICNACILQRGISQVV